MRKFKVFIAMPFDPSFDDVHQAIREAANAASTDEMLVSAVREDDIDVPGKITEHMMNSIRESNLVVADVSPMSGEIPLPNPNVMWEFGFAHALGKQTILLSQNAKSLPFNVQDFRCLSYDRSHLTRDLRLRLKSLFQTTADLVSDVLEEEVPWQAPADRLPSQRQADSTQIFGAVSLIDLRLLEVAVAEARTNRDVSGQAKLGKEALQTVDRITLVGLSVSDQRSLAGTAGNLAVEFERAKDYGTAEILYKRISDLVPDHAGVRLQHADMLVDLGRFDEAQSLLDIAMVLDPNDRRVLQVRAKIAMKSGGSIATEDVQQYRNAWEMNPTQDAAAIAYISVLQGDPSNADEVLRVCDTWQPRGNKARRIYADFLATHERRVDAIEVYKLLLSDPLVDQRSAILHNMATLLDNLGREIEAFDSWALAYDLDKSDQSIRVSFSQRLQRWSGERSNKVVVNVLRGEAIDSDGIAQIRERLIASSPPSNAASN